MLLLQTFLPLLKKASAHQPGDRWGVDRAAIVSISSFWASISQNEDGSADVGALAYKMSKVRRMSGMLGPYLTSITSGFQSALNQLGKTMAIDLENDKILVAQICPGWVQTDIGNMTEIAPLTVGRSSWYSSSQT